MGDVQIHWQDDPTTGVLTATATLAGPSGSPITLTAQGNVRSARELLTSKYGPTIKRMLAARNPTAVAGSLQAINRCATDAVKQGIAANLQDQLVRTTQSASVGEGWWLGDMRVTTDDVKSIQHYLRAGSDFLSKAGNQGDVEAFLRANADRIASDVMFAANAWTKISRNNRNWIHDHYGPPSALEKAGKSALKVAQVALPIASTIFPVLAPFAIAADLGPVIGAATKVATAVLGDASKAPAFVKAAATVVKKAQAGDPKATSYMQSVASKAKAGDPKSIATARIMTTVAQPMPPTAAAPSASPSYADLQAAAAGCAIDAIAGCGDMPNTIAGAADPVYAAQRVFMKAKAGDQKAKAFLSKMLLAANAGDKNAIGMRDVFARASKLGSAEGAPHHAAAGMTNLFEHAAPMNVKNYYQISGVQLPPFYGNNVNAVNPQAEIAVGADGKVLEKQFDPRTRSWRWQQMRRGGVPVVARRSVLANNGVNALFQHGARTSSARFAQ